LQQVTDDVMELRVRGRRQPAVGHDVVHVLLDASGESLVLRVGLRARMDRGMVGVERGANACHARAQGRVGGPGFPRVRFELRNERGIARVCVLVLFGHRLLAVRCARNTQYAETDERDDARMSLHYMPSVDTPLIVDRAGRRNRSRA
jgi:hypothetical protein